MCIRDRDVIEKHIRESIGSMKNGTGVEQLMTGFWKQMDIQDEEELSLIHI